MLWNRYARKTKLMFAPHFTCRLDGCCEYNITVGKLS